jgi:hypothetical protein
MGDVCSEVLLNYFCGYKLNLNCMYRNFLAFVLMFVVVHISYSQLQYKLPQGFAVKKDYDDKEIKSINDFDLDGIDDLAICVGKGDSELDNHILIYLSRFYKSAESAQVIEFPSELLMIESYNGGFNISMVNCMGRCETKLNFEYDRTIGNLKLIALSDSHLPSMFGTGMEDSGYNKEYNFSTGIATVDGEQKKFKPAVVTPDKFNQFWETFELR